MIGSRRVMRRGSSLCVLVPLVAGCWSTEPLVEGTFTPEQWQWLQHDYAPPQPPDWCDVPGMHPGSPVCKVAALLGQQLFWEPALSDHNQVSCVTCHDPGDVGPDPSKHKNGWFADVRLPDNVSVADTGWTKRNSISVINVALKDKYAAASPHDVFAWGGKYKTSGAVFELAVTKAMHTSHRDVADVIRNSPEYLQEYVGVFSRPVGPPCASTSAPPACAADDQVVRDLGIVLEVYMRRLISLRSPFDLYISNSPSPLMTDSAKRGFGVFVGRGMCAECHGGAMFSDYGLHNTGVPQVGDHVVSDGGRFDDTHEPADLGMYVTPSLRHVARTAPYMHDGAFASLAEVIEFYRMGGVHGGYVGVRDPRIQPSSMTDQDAIDLEAFLNSLTGEPVAPQLRGDIRPLNVCTIMGDPNPGTVCSGTCVDTQLDPNNCGGCDHHCGPNEVCMGSCFPTSGMCPMPLTTCAAGCTDLRTDPMHCGSCGHACMYPALTCVMGTCQ